MFYFLPIKSWCHEFFELSSTLSWQRPISYRNQSRVLYDIGLRHERVNGVVPVSCDHVTSFNYGDKKVRDIGFTCWYILSNIIPDSIFHESMRCWIICSILFLFVCLFVCLLCYYLFVVCFFSLGAMLGGWCFCFLENERVDGTDYSSVIFEVWTMSEDSRLANSIAWFLCLCIYMLCCF